MRPITFDRVCYSVDGRPFYLNAGEFHYFRVPKTDWRRRMELFKEAGGNCLATSAWLIHEQKRCFVSTLARVRSRGFSAAEEMVFTSCASGHTNTRAHTTVAFWWLFAATRGPSRTLEANRWATWSVLHPTFLAKVRNWFSAVCPILTRHTVNQGGPIAFTQIDNELMGIHIWFGGLDYHPDAMGIGDHQGRYPRFLSERYGDIAHLNARYGTAYGSFTDVMPLAPHKASGELESVRRLRDYFDFYRAATTEYAIEPVPALSRRV